MSATLPQTQAEHVVRALGCHPLAIRECARLLSEDQIRGSAHIPDPIPLTERLLDAWGGAFSALPLPSQAAVLGLCVTRGAGSGLLDWVLADCGIGRADLAAAVEAGLVQLIPGSAGRARPDVTHPLIASAVLTAAGEGPTRAMHGRAARGARALNLAPAAVIDHLFSGSDPGDPAAVHALEAEAQRALDNGQAATAARALQAAAELSISGEHRGRLAARAAQSLLTVTPYVGEVEVLLDMLARADLTHQESIWADWLRAEYMLAGHAASLTFLVMAADRAREVDSEALPHILWSATSPRGQSGTVRRHSNSPGRSSTGRPRPTTGPAVACPPGPAGRCSGSPGSSWGRRRCRAGARGGTRDGRDLGDADRRGHQAAGQCRRPRSALGCSAQAATRACSRLSGAWRATTRRRCPSCATSSSSSPAGR